MHDLWVKVHTLAHVKWCGQVLTPRPDRLYWQPPRYGSKIVTSPRRDAMLLNTLLTENTTLRGVTCNVQSIFTFTNNITTFVFIRFKYFSVTLVCLQVVHKCHSNAYLSIYRGLLISLFHGTYIHLHCQIYRFSVHTSSWSSYYQCIFNLPRSFS